MAARPSHRMYPQPSLGRRWLEYAPVRGMDSRTGAGDGAAPYPAAQRAAIASVVKVDYDFCPNGETDIQLWFQR